MTAHPVAAHLTTRKWVTTIATQRNATSGDAYETFAGSPASEGRLQFDLWGVTPSGRWDWTALKEQVKEHGMRNSLLVAPMPTASTSQILGNNECIEPYTSNVCVARHGAGPRRSHP